jgi:hypothetical protein
MLSKRIKRYVIGPILILIIIVMTSLIIHQVANGTFLAKYNVIQYSSGCREVFIKERNLTPLCERDRVIISILNWSGDYDPFNNKPQHWSSTYNSSIEVQI